MGDIDKGDTKLLVHILEFHLHIMAHLEVESCERFVKQEYLRLVDDSTSDGYTLLLTARERVRVAIFVIRKANRLQGCFHLAVDCCLVETFEL